MNQIADYKLKKIIENNKEWPIIVSGVESDFFEQAVRLSADIEAVDLHHKSQKYEVWTNALQNQAQEKGPLYFVIEGMDKVSPEEQEKFIPLLKDRRAGSFQLPAQTRIILLVSDMDKVSQKIMSTALSWKVTQ